MIVIFEFYVSIFIFNISIFVSSISGNREHVDTVLQLTECNFDIQTDVFMNHLCREIGRGHEYLRPKLPGLTLDAAQRYRKGGFST